MTSDQMNALLRDELSAVETYQQALGKGEDRLGHETEFEQLAAILKDHQRAAARLKPSSASWAVRRHTSPVLGVPGPR
jgi:hypothetical protein